MAHSCFVLKRKKEALLESRMEGVKPRKLEEKGANGVAMWSPSLNVKDRLSKSRTSSGLCEQDRLLATSAFGLLVQASRI